MNNFILYKYKNINNVRNIGDWIQTLAVKNCIEKIYNKNNLNYIFSERDDIYNDTNISGLCIHQGYFSDYITSNFVPNSNIESVWIGTHLNKKIKDNININIFKNQNDFGCRDKETKNFFKSLNKESYFSRCLTLTFDKTLKNIERNKNLILINYPNALNKYISKLRFDKIYSVNQNFIFKSEIDNYKNLENTQNLLNYYKNNASLVITTKLHAALPCIAMGIPVIFINIGIEPNRFSTLDGIIHQYTIDDLINNRINWNPQPVDIEDLKQLMIRNVELSINKKLGLEYNNDELIDIRNKIENYNIL